MRPLLLDIQNIVVTFTVAMTTGYAFQQLGLPAPFLLGSLFGVWVIGSMVGPIRRRLGVPRWLHIPVVLGLGTLIGANFRPDVLLHISAAAVTVTAMFVATILATLAGLAYLMRVRKYSFVMALLSCIPGGQAEVILLSRDLVEKDYVVALFHLVRVALVFCSTPLILALVEGQAAVDASSAALLSMPSLFDLDAKPLVIFLTISIVSLPLARLAKIPMPHLLGPLLVSSVLHIIGVIELPRISEFVVLAQVIIGGSVGARLARVPFVDLAGYIRDAIINSIIVLSTYGLTAYVIASFTGIDFIKMLLAFVPGGLYEVTLLALIFGFDVAFVAFHHTIRVMLVFFSLPMIVTYAQKRTAAKKTDNLSE